MSLGKKLFIGGVTACTTDTVDKFGDSSGIALYTLDYDASDESGNYDGTSSNVTFGVDGQINWGASFNGSSSKIDLPNLGTGVSGSSARSVSAWIKLDDTPSGFETVYASGSGSNGSAFAFFVTSSKKIRLYYYNRQYDSSTVLNVGQWYHIVVTYNGGNIQGSVNSNIYINGNVETISDAGGTATGVASTTNSNYSIGYERASTNYYFDGEIDQVRIFDKAISSSEVSTLYEETACVYTSTTDTVNYQGTNLAYYKLDGNALDETTNNYDGTESNITYEFGRYGAAAVFNGANSYITLPSTLSQGNVTVANCISFWFYIDAEVTSSSFNNEIMTFAGSTSVDGKIALGSTSGHITNETFSVTSNVSSGEYTYSRTNIPAGWNHAVVQWNSGNTKWDIFINGVQHTTYTNGTNVQRHWKLRFGRRGTAYFAGKLDQVKIFDSALDATAVANLYNEKQAYITKDASNPFGDSNEVAFYKFENNSNDSTGSNNGTDTSITYTSGSGIIGTYSADFNGSSSYIIVPHSSTFNWTNNKTLSVWVKFDAVASLRGIVAKGSGSAPYGWVLYMTSTSKIQFVQYNSLSQASTLASSFTAVTNKWYHVCVTGDGTTNKLYIDGSLNHSAVAVTATNGTDALVLGRLYSDTNNYYHSGEIDQLRFFDRTLDGDEVFKLYAEVIN